LIVRLTENDELKSLLFDEKHHRFVLKTSELRDMNIPVDENLNVDVTSIQCKCFTSYVTVIFKVK
jgi:hypothetical protein